MTKNIEVPITAHFNIQDPPVGKMYTHNGQLRMSIFDGAMENGKGYALVPALTAHYDSDGKQDYVTIEYFALQAGEQSITAYVDGKKIAL